MKISKKTVLASCAAAAFTIGASMTSYAASGWRQEDGSWYYYNADGEKATDTWKKSGDNWFWLDSDGDMAISSLVEDDDKWYYVNESGAMVKNEWRELDNEDGDDDEADTCWYYFGSNGRAYKASDSGKVSFKTIGRADGTSAKYAFDEDGKMLYGWIDEDGERQTDDDAWRNGVYYLGEAGDGALRSSQWARLEVEDDDNEDGDFDGTYWFWFNSNGKKVADTTKKINGRQYRFEENGNAVFNWYTASASSASSASASNMYYNSPEQCWRAEGWFYSVPDENIDPEGYDSGDEYWFYAKDSGELVTSQIKKINGQYYAFNEFGEMLHGLYKLSINDGEIQAWEEIESEDDMPEEDEAWEVYYFGDSPKEGAMKTGKTTIDLDGEDYTFNFRKSGTDRGAGYNEIHDDSIYIKGRMMKADKDSKLEIVEFDGEEYLVNTSGKIQKKKTNTKDADDRYYCTDSSGIVTYSGFEKWEKED